MDSFSVKAVFAVLALAFLATAGAQSPSVEARHTSPNHQAPAKMLAGYRLPQGGDTRGRFDTSAQQPLLIASVGAPAEFSFDQAARRHDLAAGSSAFEVREWMLIAIGIFLVLAMSHRRSRSLTD